MWDDRPKKVLLRLCDNRKRPQQVPRRPQRRYFTVGSAKTAMWFPQATTDDRTGAVLPLLSWIIPHAEWHVNGPTYPDWVIGELWQINGGFIFSIRTLSSYYLPIWARISINLLTRAIIKRRSRVASTAAVQEKMFTVSPLPRVRQLFYRRSVVLPRLIRPTCNVKHERDTLLWREKHDLLSGPIHCFVKFWRAARLVVGVSLHEVHIALSGISGDGELTV